MRGSAFHASDDLRRSADLRLLATGGYDNGQAQYVRVPFADVGPVAIPDLMHDEDAVLLTDAARSD